MLKTINANGSLKTTINAVSASSFINGGLAYLPDGALHVVIAGDTLTDQFYSGGMAVTAEGALYITFDTPAASAVVNGGLLCRVDGAVHVNVASGYFAGGLPISALGEMYIAPQDTSYFYAPRTSSITQTRGAGTPTETRATVATVMGYAADATLADGQTLLTVASGELRFQGARRVSEGVWSNVDADGAPIPAATLKGAVVEAAATNLCLQSNAFTTTWAANGTPAATQNVIGPDGATSAWTLTDNDGAVLEYVSQDITLTAAFHVASVLVKKTMGAQSSYPCVVCLSNVGTLFAVCTVDTSNGVATAWTNFTARTAATGLTARCTSFNDNFWLVEVVFTATAVAWFFALIPAATTSATYAGPSLDAAVTGSAVFYGAQVELGSYATAYQATTTAAVTRNKDVLDDQVSSNLTAAAGTVAFTWTPSHDPSGTIALCGSYVDASNYTALLHDSTKYIWRKRISGVNYDAELTAAYANGTSAKIALTLGASGINLAVDGTLGTAHANTDDAQLGTRWQWGADGNGGQQAGAAFKEMYLTPRTMSDAELQAITV